jgi:hypothetical protein
MPRACARTRLSNSARNRDARRASAIPQGAFRASDGWSFRAVIVWIRVMDSSRPGQWAESGAARRGRRGSMTATAMASATFSTGSWTLCVRGRELVLPVGRRFRGWVARARWPRSGGCADSSPERLQRRAWRQLRLGARIRWQRGRQQRACPVNGARREEEEAGACGQRAGSWPLGMRPGGPGRRSCGAR